MDVAGNSSEVFGRAGPSFVKEITRWMGVGAMSFPGYLYRG